MSKKQGGPQIIDGGWKEIRHAKNRDFVDGYLGQRAHCIHSMRRIWQQTVESV